MTSALDGDECLTSRPGRLTPWKESRYPLNGKLSRPQSRSGHFGEDKNISCSSRYSKPCPSVF